MPDCLHEQLRHDHYQVNLENPQSPVFDVIRCKQCNQLLTAFPIDRQHGTLEAILGGINDMQKTLIKIEAVLKRKPK